MLDGLRLPESTSLAVACAQDSEVLSALRMAREDGLKTAFLVGDEPAIRKLSEEIGLSLDGFAIQHEHDPKLACALAVSLVKTGQANLLMKGLVDTSVLLKAVLDKQAGILQGRRLSHAAYVLPEGYHKAFVITDGAVNIAPTVEEKKDILENALLVTRALGLRKPRVMLISAVEKVSQKMQSTLDAQELKSHYQSDPRMQILGPLALDIAVSSQAAKHKGYLDDAAGQPDLLLMPNIESGNVLYKALVHFAGAQSASVVLGARVPLVVTSRSDSDAVKRNSILLAALMANEPKERG